MSADEVIQYHVDRGLGLLRINRPQARNALNWEAQEKFAQAVDAAAADPSLRALIITGNGPHAFAAGGDLKELATYDRSDAGRRLNRIMTAALGRLPELPFPVIAAINGDAYGGGCEIITACDFRLAAGHARLHFSQVKVALTPGWGGAGRLIRLVGQSRALELLMTGRALTAGEARHFGLVHEVVPAGSDVLDEATKWAGRFLALPRQALAASKALVYAAGHLSPAEMAQYEADVFVALWGTADHDEALAAFMGKREPVFGRMSNDE